MYDYRLQSQYLDSAGKAKLSLFIFALLLCGVHVCVCARVLYVSVHAKDKIRGDLLIWMRVRYVKYVDNFKNHCFLRNLVLSGTFRQKKYQRKILWDTLFPFSLLNHCRPVPVVSCWSPSLPEWHSACVQTGSVYFTLWWRVLRLCVCGKSAELTAHSIKSTAFPPPPHFSFACAADHKNNRSSSLCPWVERNKEK